jgi:hypothetical protein
MPGVRVTRYVTIVVMFGCLAVTACKRDQAADRRRAVTDTRTETHADASANTDAALDPGPEDAASPQPDGGNDAGAFDPLESCISDPPTVCPDPAPHYPDVAPIFAARCVSCHNGGDGQWPLSEYQHVADWSGEIRGQLIACTMPPAEARVPITRDERMLILTWIRCGFSQ